MPVIAPAISERNFTPTSTGLSGTKEVEGVLLSGQMLTSEEDAGDEVGVKEIVADADLVVSATLVAVTVTVWAEAIEAGAVYVPEANDPTPGFKDQFTPVLLVPVTVAVNCAV